MPGVPDQQRSAEPRSRRPAVDENGIPYGIGPFTLREVVFLGLSFVVLLASFLPLVAGVFVGYPQSLWAPFGWFVIPGVLLMLAAAVLIVLRRLVPTVRWRVGSLSVDQFASVATIATASFYLGMLLFVASLPGLLGALIAPGAGIVVGFVASVLALVVTTFSVFIPMFRDDFTHRTESPAHLTARQATPVPRRPKPERPAAPFSSDSGQAPGVEQFDPFAAPYPPMTPPEPVGPRYARSSATWPSDDREDDVSGPSVTSTAAYDALRTEDAVENLLGRPDAADDCVDEEPLAETQLGVAPGAPSTATPAESAAPGTAAGSAEVESGEAESAEIEPATTTGAETVAAGTEGPRAPGAAAEPEPGSQTSPEIDAVQESPADEFLDESDVETQAAPRSAFSHVSAAAAPQEAEPAPRVVSTQPFWVYSAVPRTVVDEATGAPLFQIGPTAWALAIVDRGTELVIRHDDGRVGVLRHIDGLMRG